MRHVTCLTLLVALIVTSYCTNVKKSEVGDILKKNGSDKNAKNLIVNLQKNIKHATDLGLIMGTTKTAKKMELNIIKLIQDLIMSFQGTNMKQSMDKFKVIQDTIDRDRKAMAILSSAVNVTMNTKTVHDYHQALSKLTAQNSKPTKAIPKDRKELMKQAQRDVKQHIEFLRKNINETIAHVKPKPTKKKSVELSFTPSALTSPYDSHFGHVYETYNLPSLYIRMPIWPVYKGNVESFYRFRRQNDDATNGIDGDIPKENEKVEEGEADLDDEEFGDGLDAPGLDGGGGLAGLIAGLSGGEGGSDVGALVGAISSVVTNLFGPGGLDVPSLISTGTSLISGLLGGDENFGKVLGNYIGLAVEGLSGGGGADNNGAFFGNFVGTLFAQLSADPEEDDAPPQPKIFFENFLKGFDQTKQKRGTNEPSKPRNYIFEFISNIISSVVGGITSLVLNSSLGSSGGSSQGAADLSAGSSQGSHAGSAYASQSSSGSSMMPPHMKPK